MYAVNKGTSPFIGARELWWPTLSDFERGVAGDRAAFDALLAQAGQHYTMLASRSEEHTSELQSLMRISYAVFCLKKKKTNQKKHRRRNYIQHTEQHNIISVNNDIRI